MDSEGAQLIASSLLTKVIETILQSRAPSMRKLYALKLKLFKSWCGDRQLDLVNCPVGTVLEFLHARFSAGLTQSTLNVYVAAIAAYHGSLGDQSVGRHPLVTYFLYDVLRLSLRPEKFMLIGGSGYYSIALSPLISPLLGGQGSLFKKLAFGTRAPPTLATPGTFFSP